MNSKKIYNTGKTTCQKATVRCQDKAKISPLSMQHCFETNCTKYFSDSPYPEEDCYTEIPAWG